MEVISLFILSLISQLLGVQPIPNNSLNEWTIKQNWTKNQNNVLVFIAESESIAEKCKSNPEYFIDFPMIIHGAHTVLIDQNTLKTFGDPTFKTTRTFYGSPLIKCNEITNGKKLQWIAYSYTNYFARFSNFPFVTEKVPIKFVFNETLNIIAAGSLFLISILMFIISYSKLPNKLVFSFCISSLLFSGYFFFNSPFFFGINITMFLAHKIADIFVWLGATLFLYTLFKINVISIFMFRFFTAIVVPSLFIIIFGSTSDVIQLGTTLPFFPILIVLSLALINQVKEFLMTNNYLILLKITGLAFWIIPAINEIFVVTGFFNSFMLFSVGSIGALFFFSLALHESILITYNERDYLRQNLEVEVEMKTKSLLEKSTQLEEALQNLKIAQNSLVQSEKLASLGTLSAGIAHEINNSLNYVSGSLSPIQKILSKNELGEPDKKKIISLVELMKEGLQLTFGIIKNLKNQTRDDDGTIEKIQLKTAIQDTCLLMSNKSLNIKFENNVSESIFLESSIVSLSQIILNLVTNAMDALEEFKKTNPNFIPIIKFDGGIQNNFVWFSVHDNGPGIPKEIQSKIFDPFFTTKAPGKGTGLGLHIVFTEIKKFNGKIEMHSSQESGTQFKVWMMKNKMILQEKRVA